MKRLGSADFLSVFTTICPTAEQQHSPRNSHVYTRELKSVLENLDEEGCLEESGQVTEKKRRLSIDQVTALEKNFEVEKKLEPERKVKLAQELGLQPRQIAVWFQNRRARSKTKQLERDYGLLKANYELLKDSYDRLHHDNQAFLIEIRELKSKLNEGSIEKNVWGRDEAAVPSDSENKTMEEQQIKQSAAKCEFVGGASVLVDFKDASSDGDSSAILNEGSSPNAGISSSGIHDDRHGVMMSSPGSASMDCFRFSDSKAILEDTHEAYQSRFVKIEEHDFFGGDESCNFFSEDQAPTLHWYLSDQWA